ncbi:MAG: hypothetical protein V7641_4132 [Blastocatellia bacterium]
MNAKTNSIAIAASVLLVVVCSGFLEAQSEQRIARREGNGASGQTTRASISVMPDAPLALQIAQPENRGVDPQDPEVELVISNTTDKPVNAYAIRYDIVSNGQLRPGGVELNNISAVQFLLQPKQMRTADIGGVHYSMPIEQIIVSIDFVEYTDGTTWGVDTYSSGEVLAGLRAGAQTATRYLHRLLTEQGAASFAGGLERAAGDVSIPVGHSSKWQEGFQRGVAFITERAKHEIGNSSPAEIERALSLPIDALDEIKRSRQ